MLLRPAEAAMKKSSKKSQSPTPGIPEAKGGSIKHALLGLYGVTGLTLSYVTPIKLPFAEGYAKDHWRQALGGLLLVLFLFFGLIGLALYLVEANDFKSQIVDYVKTHKQRDLVLDGDIQVAFFPKLGLDTGKMSLSQRNGSQTFASVDNARLYVAWWPLLRMQLQVERVVFDGLHANVIRHKDGSTNFDDLLVTGDPLGDVQFAVEKIRVIDSSIKYQDDALNMSFLLRDLELETGRLADATAGKVTTSFRIQSNQPQLDTQVKLAGHVLYDRASNRYEVANLEGLAQGEAAGISQLALDFRGSLKVYPATQQLELDKFSASAQGQFGQHKLEARLLASQLKRDKNQWQGSAWSLDASLSQDIEKHSFALEVPVFDVNKKTLHSADVLARVELSRAGRAWQGQFNSPLGFDFETRRLDLETLIGNWSASHPLLTGRISASANGRLQANWATQEIKLDFKTQFDDSQFSGNVQVQDFKSPGTIFDVAVNALDLDHYLVSDWAARLKDPTLPFDFSGLKDWNLRGKLRIDEFRLAKLKTSQLVAEIRVDPSGIAIEPVQAHLYDGTLQGGFAIAAAEQPRFTFRQKLSGVQLTALLGDILPGEARLTGKGNLAWDLVAQGSNLAELRDTLSGSASLALTRGTIAGVNLTEALLAGKDQLGIPDAQRSDSVRLTDSTAYTELKASIDIEQGQAHSADVLMTSPLFTGRGEADYAFDTGLLEGRLNTTVAPGLKRSSAGELADLSGITIPVQLIGPGASATLGYSLGEASGGNLPRLAKSNLVKATAASAALAAQATSK
jgi:AsmA protein